MAVLFAFSLCVFAAAAIIFFVMYRNELSKGISRLYGILSILFTVISLSSVGSLWFIELAVTFRGLNNEGGLFLEGGYGKVAVFDKNGDIESTGNSIAFCTYNCVNYPKDGAVAVVSSEVKPITDNPKVRDLRYTVYVEFADSKKFLSANLGSILAPHNGVPDVPEFFRSPASIDRVSAVIEKRIKYWLYEFNDKYSKELARFYNPLDPKQQADMTTLVYDYLDLNLGNEGLKTDRSRPVVFAIQ